MRHWWSEYNHEKHKVLKIPGTRPYVAPEVVRNAYEALSQASDIWAVGCIGAELVTNRRLFDTPEMLEDYIANGRVDPLQYGILERHPEIINVLGGCLRVERDSRVSIFDLRAEVERLREQFP